MKICYGISESRPQMQKCHGRLVHHSCIAVSSTAAASLKKAKYRTNSGNLFQSIDNVDFSRSRICKTDFNAGINRGMD
ncbi:MAG: hypothetical protein A4E66_01310 [Syntrophus sp. PtaB.Bin001]|nr:MAG: hypothetical protein A4E66_01310 [Syntrophus sp. PtaB.Bin001]